MLKILPHKSGALDPIWHTSNRTLPARKGVTADGGLARRKMMVCNPPPDKSKGNR